MLCSQVFRLIIHFFFLQIISTEKKTFLFGQLLTLYYSIFICSPPHVLLSYSPLVRENSSGQWRSWWTGWQRKILPVFIFIFCWGKKERWRCHFLLSSNNFSIFFSCVISGRQFTRNTQKSTTMYIIQLIINTRIERHLLEYSSWDSFTAPCSYFTNNFQSVAFARRLCVCVWYCAFCRVLIDSPSQFFYFCRRCFFFLVFSIRYLTTTMLVERVYFSFLSQQLYSDPVYWSAGRASNVACTVGVCVCV